MIKSIRYAVATLGMLLALPSTPAPAADLVVWSGGAVKSAVSEALADFAKSSGVKVTSDFAPMGALTKRLAADPSATDIAILSAEVMEDAIKRGWVQSGSVTEVGRVGVGVAVNEKAPSPDISTPAAFKATLLAAKSIVMIDPATGTSGKHLAEVFQRLGIAHDIKARTTYLAGGYVVEPVGRGEIELGLHQITEILPVKGIKLVGPLPSELQKITIYQAAVSARPKNMESAKAFLVHLQTPAVRAFFANKGFMNP
ncbi:MAG: substrate-binding domain-containing protein [Hyphomicrobiaceae bacterium]